MQHSYSLYELNEYIRRVMALNFAEPVWINCEISSIKEVRGNYYLDLVEQDEFGDIKAQISAAIWNRTYSFIKNKLGVLAKGVLSPGTHVLIKANVDFNERYGLKLIIEDIDPSYTIGKLELAKQQILERLRIEGVTETNKALRLPTVIKRIAVISSENAEGLKDFMKQLADNGYGYRYDITLYPSAMQGQNTEREVCQALDSINKNRSKYDVICIMRGGGSKIDLSFFDNFNIGYKVATSSLPVLTGIGHENDTSITDMMANLHLKTPTAVAAFIIDHTAQFESTIIELELRIKEVCDLQVRRAELVLQELMHHIRRIPERILAKHQNELVYYLKLIDMETRQRIAYAKNEIQSLLMNIHASDPEVILQKGYVVLSQNGKDVKRGSVLQEGVATVLFVDGRKEVIIKLN